MKFHGNGVVWDSKKNKVLCKFIQGEYETDNKYEIEYLSMKGYESDGMQQEENKEEEIVKETKPHIANKSKRKR